MPPGGAVESGALSNMSMANATAGELSALGADDSNLLKVLEIFRFLSLSQSFPDAPNCDLLDISVVEQLARRCTGEDGLVDLLHLHNLLQDRV